MGNDLGGNAKTLFSIDNGINNSGAVGGYSAADLLTQDTARIETTSSDTSLNGAKIWITSDGKVGYDASALNAQIATLSAGEFFTDSFIYAIRLGNGTLSWATATVRIAGYNDGPVAAADTNTVKEDTAPNLVSGNVLANDTDVDTHDSHTVTAVNGSAAKVGVDVAGTYGTLHLNSDGTYTYTLNNAQANVQALAAGQQVYDTFSYTNSDNHGGSSTANLAIRVTGTNDTPVITSSAQGGLATEWADLSAAEAANTPHTASGAMTFTDVDTLDSHTASFAPQSGGYLGTFTLNTTHHDTGNGGSIGWSFSVSDSALDYLRAGQTLTQNYDVTISDGHGGTVVQTVTVTITGTNDAPVITSAAQSGNVSEGDDLPAAAQTATGQVTFTDVDTSDTHTLSVSVAAAHGTATVDPDGTWHYTVLDSGAVDALAVGEHLADSFTVQVDDHKGGLATQLVSIDITGTNDAPVLDLDANNSTASSSNCVATFTDTGSAVAIADSDVSIIDPDNANMASAIVTLTNAKAGDVLAINGSLLGGITSTINTSTPGVITVTLSGFASKAAYDAALNQIVFSTSINPDTTDRNITVAVNDGLANSNTATSTIHVVDATAPAAPAITGFTTDSGAVGDHITNDTTLTVDGTAEANSTVTVFRDGVSQGTTAANGAGIWHYVDTTTLSNGTTYQYSATATDAAANTSVVSSNYAATIDTAAPAAPVITGFTTDSGAVGDHITNDTTLTINGTAEANATVTVFENGVPIGTATADGSGNWSKVDANVLVNGTTYQFTATQTDVAGNTSVASTSYAATIDTSAPAAPTSLDLAAADDTGSSSTDNITKNTSALTISGSGENGATVTLGDDTNGDGTVDVVLGTATVSGGTFSLDVSLASGTHNLRASQADAAGNTSTLLSALAITVDTTAAAPTALDLATADDTGSSNTDNITKNTSALTISGSGENGATVTLFDDANNNGVVDAGESLGTTTVSAGAFALDVSLVAGTHNVRAVQTDVAGNVSAASTTHALDITVDTTAPTVTVTSNPTSVANRSSSTITFQFSEDVTGFDVSDPTATRGNLTGFATIDANTYTETYNRTSNGANAHVDVAAGTYTDLAGNLGGGGGTGNLPAGVAGSPINLGLADPTGFQGEVTLTVTGAPSDWTLNGATHNSDGSWTVVTNDVGSLTVTTPVTYTGALLLNVAETWINADGSIGYASVADNVEAYAPGSPIFALSGDDNLTGSSDHDMFVFSQPIGYDVIYSFDAASDQIDLIGYADFIGFGDIQAHAANDAAGNAVITLADGQSITLNGVDASSLTADNFVFDQTPVTENADHMVISDGAILPLSGIIDNTGTIELNSSGNEADLQLIELGITLLGGGHVELTDSSENAITGTVSDVTLTNVDNIIAGAGQLGDGVMTLVNEGTIIATGTNSLDIDTGTNAITNSGTLEATGSGGLLIHSDVINTGVLWANDGNVTIDGNVSGNGSVLISGTATLEFAQASAENTTFATGAAGTLILGDSFNFSGTVSGMTEDDHIDLLDFNFANAPTLDFTPNADNSGGTLSITDGAHTANIALLGSFDPTGFQIEADRTMGTLVSYHDFHLA